MSWTNSRVTKWMDEYFKKRPQLHRPNRNILGYEVPTPIHHALNSMLNEITQERQIKEAEKKILIKNIEKNAKLTSLVSKLLVACTQIDCLMSGNVGYKSTWLNWPEKPEETPQSRMKEAIKAAEEVDTK